MATIAEATRICKRIILTNLLTNDHSITVTPLLSGRHGIGKSQIAKRIAADIGGVCITIEGGTLKEGEITGIPYQYKNDSNETEFRFLPYYAIHRIQAAEKLLYKNKKQETSVLQTLNGTENMYSVEDLTFEQKEAMILEKKVTPVILFFDEINRTDYGVFRELMNIILTRTVNGYRLPWWVFIVAAMNPSTLNSSYATNEMDPAQADRFIKIKVTGSPNEWLEYAAGAGVDKSIINFISTNSVALAATGRELEDDTVSDPSPRGWSMIDLILKSKHRLDSFFSKQEISFLDKDIQAIVAAKVGYEASAMYFASLKDPSRIVVAADLFSDGVDTISKANREALSHQSTARNAITSKSIVHYLTDNIPMLTINPKELSNTKSVVSEYMKLIDSSSRLMFATSITNAEPNGNLNIFDYLYDIFDDEIIDLLQTCNLNQKKVEKAI